MNRLERKLTETTLEESDRRFRSLIENATDIIVILDETGIFRYCSPSAERVLGYRLEDVAGKSAAELVHPEDVVVVMEVLQKAVQNPRVAQTVIEYRVRHLDGSWRTFEAVATSLLDDPAIRGVVVNCHDITDRNRVEEALRAANRQIANILGSVTDAFVSLDQNWCFTYLNNQAAQLIQRSREELLGQNLWETFPDFMGSILDRECNKALSQKIPVSFEEFYPFLRTWFEVRVFPTADGLSLFLVDVTERRHAQAELLEMSTALGNAVEGIARLDIQGKYIALNRAYAEALGYEQSEIIGMAWQDTVYAEDIAIAQSSHQQMLAQGKAEAEVRAIRKDGSTFYKEIMMVAAYDWYDQLIGHHCFTRDITERKLAEAARLQQAERESELYRQVRQLNANLEAQVRERTAQLQQALTYEAMLKRITDSVRDSLDEDQILQNAVQELALGLGTAGCDAGIYDLDQGTSTIRYEYIRFGIPTAKGSTLKMTDDAHLYSQLFQAQYFQFCCICDNGIRPLVGLHAAFVCPIVDDQSVMGDLWLFKQADEAFTDLEIRLVQQVANQCAIALRQARLHHATQAQVTALEELNQLKDDFLSAVSHELRTPMSTMKVAIHMLKTMNNPERQQQCLDILQFECSREIDLIDDLLDLQRLEAFSYPLSPVEIDLQECLAHLVKPFQLRMLDRQQHLQIRIPANLPSMVTDRQTLERVLAELLNNACKYTPPDGEVILSVEPMKDRFSDRATNIVFSVINQAEIPAAELSRIFDRFYRVPNGDRWRQGGTGLGLDLVQRRVTELGGSIQVESSHGWTTFTVRL